MSPAAGLRERKKQQTRDRIVRTALRLFAKRGFEATTIADIAAAADVAPRTFFAYFPSKEAVVFHDFAEVHDRFAERLRGRPPEETVFDALRAWIVEWMRTRRSEPTHRRQHEVILATPALQAHERENLARFGDLIAEGVAADLDVAPDSLRARLVSAAAVAALESLRDFDPGTEDEDRALAILDHAIEFLQGGLDALRRAPA